MIYYKKKASNEDEGSSSSSFTTETDTFDDDESSFYDFEEDEKEAYEVSHSLLKKLRNDDNKQLLLKGKKAQKEDDKEKELLGDCSTIPSLLLCLGSHEINGETFKRVQDTVEAQQFHQFCSFYRTQYDFNTSNYHMLHYADLLGRSNSQPMLVNTKSKPNTVVMNDNSQIPQHMYENDVEKTTSDDPDTDEFNLTHDYSDTSSDGDLTLSSSSGTDSLLLDVLSELSDAQSETVSPENEGSNHSYSTGKKRLQNHISTDDTSLQPDWIKTPSLSPKFDAVKIEFMAPTNIEGPRSIMGTEMQPINPYNISSWKEFSRSNYVRYTMGLWNYNNNEQNSSMLPNVPYAYQSRAQSNRCSNIADNESIEWGSPSLNDMSDDSSIKEDKNEGKAFGTRWKRPHPENISNWGLQLNNVPANWSNLNESHSSSRYWLDDWDSEKESNYVPKDLKFVVPEYNKADSVWAFFNNSDNSDYETIQGKRSLEYKNGINAGDNWSNEDSEFPFI